MRIVREFGLAPVVAINRFPGDDPLEIDAICRLSLELGAFAAEVNDGFARGGARGGRARGGRHRGGNEHGADVEPLYELDAPIAAKIEAMATRAYGAAGIELSPAAAAQAKQLAEAGLDGLPVCIAKTHLSLSHDPAARRHADRLHAAGPRAPPLHGRGLDRRALRQHADHARPPAAPAALRIDVDADGLVTGLR